MEIQIVKNTISLDEVKRMARESYGHMVKAVVDIEREIVAIGGELHADANEVLLRNGSEQQNLWGINIHPEKPRDQWIEFDSLINIRPLQGNRSRNVENKAIQEKIISVVNKLVQ